VPDGQTSHRGIAPQNDPIYDSEEARMKLQDLPILIVSLIAPLAAGGLGAIATASSIPTWYRTLSKPPWNPPAGVFAPVWTLLYILMGVALFLIWRQGWSAPGVRTAVLLFAAQLVFNLLWSVVFFGLHTTGGGLVIIVILWLLIVATIVAFFRLNAVSGALMLPYIAWVTFASVLNATIWSLNR
jgi:translocator protein